jgi:hypothetical protein
MGRILISNLLFLAGLWSVVRMFMAEITDVTTADRWWFYPLHLVVSTVVCVGLLTRTLVTVSFLQMIYLGLYVIAAVLALKSFFGRRRT